MMPEPASPRGSDYAALSRHVRQSGLLDRRPRYYPWKISLTAAALALGWAAFAAIGNSWWQLADAVFLPVVFARSRRANTVLGVACGNLCTGIGYDWWAGKHSRHHDQRAGLLRRQGADRAGRSAADLPIPGLPACPDAVPRGGQPAHVEHPHGDRTHVRGGWLTDFALGGLNYQIEHHLFPSMPRPNLRRAQPLVAAFRAERGVSYTETSLLASYAQALGHLAAVGSELASPVAASKVVSTPARR